MRKEKFISLLLVATFAVASVSAFAAPLTVGRQDDKAPRQCGSFEKAAIQNRPDMANNPAPELDDEVKDTITAPGETTTVGDVET